jgi:hypothetical protein
MARNVRVATVPNPSAKSTSTKDTIERPRSHQKSCIRSSENPLLKINMKASQAASRMEPKTGRAFFRGEAWRFSDSNILGYAPTHDAFLSYLQGYDIVTLPAKTNANLKGLCEAPGEEPHRFSSVKALPPDQSRQRSCGRLLQPHRAYPQTGCCSLYKNRAKSWYTGAEPSSSWLSFWGDNAQSPALTSREIKGSIVRYGLCIDAPQRR